MRRARTVRRMNERRVDLIDDHLAPGVAISDASARRASTTDRPVVRAAEQKPWLRRNAASNASRRSPTAGRVHHQGASTTRRPAWLMTRRTAGTPAGDHHPSPLGEDLQHLEHARITSCRRTSGRVHCEPAPAVDEVCTALGEPLPERIARVAARHHRGEHAWMRRQVTSISATHSGGRQRDGPAT